MGCAASSTNKLRVLNPGAKNSFHKSYTLSKSPTDKSPKNQVSPNGLSVSQNSHIKTAENTPGTEEAYPVTTCAIKFLSDVSSEDSSGFLQVIDEEISSFLKETENFHLRRKYAEHSIKVEFSPEIQVSRKFQKVVKISKSPKDPRNLKSKFRTPTNHKRHTRPLASPSRSHTLDDSSSNSSDDFPHKNNHEESDFSVDSSFEKMSPIEHATPFEMKSNQFLPIRNALTIGMAQKNGLSNILLKSASNCDNTLWSSTMKCDAQDSSPELIRRIQTQNVRRFAVFKVENGIAVKFSAKRPDLELENIQYSKDHHQVVASKKISKNFQIKKALLARMPVPMSKDVIFDSPQMVIG